MAVQLMQHVEAVGFRNFFSRLISMFVFDILQIPNWYIQICSGYIAPTCTFCLQAARRSSILVNFPSFSLYQWRNQELFPEGDSTNSIEDRGQIELGCGGGSPLVRGSTQFAKE
jgi:hypothetical protein